MQARLYDYPEVERLVNQAPWLGHGGGTYLPVNPMFILDNQYLKTAIELGLIGVVVLVAFFLVPLISALVARRRSGDPELRLLCAALAGAALAAGVCSLTFDSLSFPMFANVYALVIGLIGACWRLAAAGKESATVRARPGPHPRSASAPSAPGARQLNKVVARHGGLRPRRETGLVRATQPQATDPCLHAPVLEPGIHVALNLRSRERPVIDAHVVEDALVELPGIRVRAHSHLAAAGRQTGVE